MAKRKIKRPTRDQLEREEQFLSMQNSINSQLIRQHCERLSRADEKIFLQIIKRLAAYKQNNDFDMDVDEFVYGLFRALDHIPKHLKESLLRLTIESVESKESNLIYLSLFIKTFGEAIDIITYYEIEQSFLDLLHCLFGQEITDIEKLLDSAINFKGLLELDLIIDQTYFKTHIRLLVFDEFAGRKYRKKSKKSPTSPNSQALEDITWVLMTRFRFRYAYQQRTEQLISLTRRLRTETDPIRAEILTKAVLNNINILRESDDQSTHLNSYTIVPGQISDPFVDMIHATRNNEFYFNQQKGEGVPHNPWTIHQQIIEYRENAKPMIFMTRLGNSVIAIPAYREIIKYYRRDLPINVHPETLDRVYQSLVNRLAQNSNLAKDLLRIASEAGISQDDQKSSDESQAAIRGKAERVLQNFKFSVVHYPEILQILELPDGEDIPLLYVTFFFYSIIHKRLCMSNEPLGKDLWSPQEEAFIKMFCMLLTCIQGKNGAICDMYKQECPRVASSTQHELVLSKTDQGRYNLLIDFMAPIQAEIQKFHEHAWGVFDTDEFYEELRKLPMSAYIPSIHHRSHVKNMFGPILNLPWDYTYDWYAAFNLDALLSKVRRPKFIEVMLKFTQPYINKPHFNNAFIEARNRIGEALRNDTTGKLADEIQYFIEEECSSGIFEYSYAPDDIDEFYPMITGLTEKGFNALLVRLGILERWESNVKISPEEDQCVADIIEKIQAANPIQTLDLSDCTWLKESDIIAILSERVQIDTLDLSGCPAARNCLTDSLFYKLCGKTYSNVKKLILRRIPDIKEIDVALDISEIVMDPGIKLQCHTAFNTFHITTNDTPITLDTYCDHYNPKNISELITYLSSLFVEPSQIVRQIIRLNIENINLNDFHEYCQVEILQRLLKEHHNMKSIHIYSFTGFEYIVFDEINTLPNLEALSLERSQINPECFSQLLSRTPNLKKLSLKGHHQLKKTTLTIIQELVPNLENLFLVDYIPPYFNKKKIVKLIESCTKLKHVDLGRFTNKKKVLAAIRTSLPSLEGIGFHFDSSPFLDLATEEEVVDFFQNKPDLKSLVLRNADSSLIHEVMGCIHNLEELELMQANDVSPYAIKSWILSFKNLRRLTINYVKQLTTTDVREIIQSSSGLTELTIKNVWRRYTMLDDLKFSMPNCKIVEIPYDA